MNITKVNSPSFKSYVPVAYYAKSPEDNKFHRVMDKKNLKKCHRIIIQNLNGTAGKKENKEFIDLFKSYDKDYRQLPVARSVYPKTPPVVYLITGSDVDSVDNMAKPIGRAKANSLDATGVSHSFETETETYNFYKNFQRYILNHFEKRLKNDNHQPLTLQVLFLPQYNKKGKLKGFEYLNARFKENVKNS